MSISDKDLHDIRTAQATQEANWERLNEYFAVIEGVAEGLIKLTDVPPNILDFVVKHVAGELAVRRGLKLLRVFGEVN